MHKMKISTLPRHNTFKVSIIVLFVVSSFVSSGVSETDRENEITESKQFRNEDETDGISATGPSDQFVKDKERDNRQRQDTGIDDEDSKPESETNSKDEDNQEPTNDTQDNSKNSEPEDETQESPGSDSRIDEKDSRRETGTNSKDEDDQRPMNDAQDNSESPEPEVETQESVGSDSEEESPEPEVETQESVGSDSEEESPEPEVETQESVGSDSEEESPEPEVETQESVGSDSEEGSKPESETDRKDEDNQIPTKDAEDNSKNPEPDDETQESPVSDNGINEKDSKPESKTDTKDEDNQGPRNDAQDNSKNPEPDDETQESPVSDNGINEKDSKPESKTDTKDEDNQGPRNDAQDNSKNPEPDDETQESPVSDNGINEKDSKMENQTHDIDQSTKGDKEHDSHQRQGVTRGNFKSKEVPDDKEQDNQGPMNDSDNDSPSSDSGMHDKNTETYPNLVVLKSKTYHIKNGKDENITSTVHVFLKGKKNHRHNGMHEKVDITNPVHVFLKGKEHHRHNGMHEKVDKTNPVHVFLKGKKHHRHNGMHEKVNKTNPVHVFLKGKKHHRHNGMHEKVDKTNPVHVFLKDKEHEDQSDSQHGYGENKHYSHEKDRYLVKEFLRARGHQHHVHKSHGGPGKHTGEHNRPQEAVFIPQESVKVADLLHISTEVKHLDTVVNRISGFVRKTLANIQNNMHEMANMVSAVHPIAPSTMSHMINVTMTKTEKAVRKMCLEPIQKSLSIPPWSVWNSWGKCSLTCGSGGYKLRHRQCQLKSHRQCLGNNFDLSHCVLTPCPATWQSWCQWTPCSATCDNGYQMRTRMCLTSSKSVHCNGTASELKPCFSPKCKSSSQKSTLLGHLLFKSKSGNKVKFHMKFAMQGSSNSTQTSSRYSWSAWSGWTSCKECRKGHRERKRICVNSLKQPLDDKTLCPGTDVEFGPCIGLVCNPGNAVDVSEGKSVEVKCPVPPDLVPYRIYWITPRNQRITHLKGTKRIRMSGSSLLVADARYADQGVYRCVLLMKNNTHHKIQDTLVVDTCKTHHCQNEGICQTTQDPEFDGIMNYKCRCIGKYSGPFCEIGPLTSYKFIGAVIALIIALVVILALSSLLLRRSLFKAKIDSQNENQWKKKGKSQTKKKTKSPKTNNKPKPAERPEDKGDISNTSIVSNDGSFVEITEHDYVDFDGFNLSQEEKNPRGGYESGHASGGYEGKFLKYPSPPYKHMSQNYQQKESDYMYMDPLPENFIMHQHNPAGSYDEESGYQDMPSRKVEYIYENLPSGERGEPIYTPTSKSEQDYIETLKYKASLKQGRASVDKEALDQEALDIVAENLTRQCLVEIENESQSSNKVVSAGLTSSLIGSNAPMLIKDKYGGTYVAIDTYKTDVSAAQTESPNRNVENTKSPQRKTKSINHTKSPRKEETARLTKSPNTGVSADHQSVTRNKAPSEASGPKGNRPVVGTGRVSPPGSRGFKQQLVTQTDMRSLHVSKDRKPVPKPRRAPEDTTRQHRIRPPVSQIHRQYAFPKKLTIKDDEQQSALHEHFDTSFVAQQVNPSTSTPKKVDKIARMNIIMPSDIMKADEDETFCRKTQSSELMVVTSSKVLGKTEEGPVDLGKGNISSNNRQNSASELSSGSEVFSDSYYQSLSQVTEPTDGRRRTSFRSLDTSRSLQAMPDLDNTVSFPKLSISYQEEWLGQSAGPATPSKTKHCYPGRNDSLFQGEITEGSLYLSDCNYTQGTPESSELSESDCSSEETSDVEGSLDCTES